jgi:DivIVA domain-containing protein
MESIPAVAGGSFVGPFTLLVILVSLVLIAAAYQIVLRVRQGQKIRANAKAKPSKTLEVATVVDTDEPLTTREIIDVRFSQTKFKEGYSQDEVDNFLDRTVAEFKRLEVENKKLKRRRDNPELVIDISSPSILTSHDVENAFFSASRETGYDMDEVDDFLDRIAYELKRRNEENQEIADDIVVIVDNNYVE